jgi:hypothetical protein
MWSLPLVFERDLRRGWSGTLRLSSSNFAQWTPLQASRTSFSLKLGEFFPSMRVYVSMLWYGGKE